MLDLLHQKINNIVPIHGIALQNDGSYQVDYIDTPSENQLAQVDSIIDNFPLDVAKIEKLNLLEAEWNNTLKNGWQTASGWKLGIDTSDVTLLTGAFMLAKESASMGLANSVSIVDIDGESHNLTLQDLTVLMLQYGEARAALSYEYATKRKNIKDATSIPELEAL